MTNEEMQARIRNVERLALLVAQTLLDLHPCHPDLEPLNRACSDLLDCCDAMSGLEACGMERVEGQDGEGCDDEH